MKKFLSCVMGAVFAFTTVAVAASCGEEGDKAPLKVTVEVAEDRYHGMRGGLQSP